jgi:hypothetical protein
MERCKKRERLVNEIELFISYGVEKKEQQAALLFLQRYKNDDLALQLMRSFYTSLPETHEEALCRIAFIEKKDDIFLLGLQTALHGYLYLATDQKALFLCEEGKELLEPKALALFGYPDLIEFLKKYPHIEKCPEYVPDQLADPGFCPVCSAVTGDYHILGCPVEVCPWCEGQLSRCGCRFEQLGLEALEDEEELEELERLLEEKGRVPYAAWQCPSYPSDKDEEDGQDE